MNTHLLTNPPPPRNRILREHVHDPYRIKLKLPEPTICPVCKAVFKDGRWQWGDSHPPGSREVFCPACKRMRDRCPAGVVMLRGDYAVKHRADILNLVHNEEKAEKAEHPLHRIMNVGEWPRTICIRTTDIHLPHRIGEAIHRAHKGNLHVHYNAESLLVRVNWSRDK